MRATPICRPLSIVSGDYAERAFGDRPELFERSERSLKRSPVFVVGAAEHNLLYPPSAEPKVRQAIVTSLPTSERHRYFGSMRSSQALTQSVFGSLGALGKEGVLSGLTADDGLPTVPSGVTVQMERLVEHLGERRTTSVPRDGNEHGGRVKSTHDAQASLFLASFSLEIRAAIPITVSIPV